MAATEDKINQLLGQIATKQNYQNFKLEVTPISSGGANYSSTLYTAVIRNDTKTDLHLFIKVAALNEKFRESLPASIFDIEKFVYTKMKDAYKKIEDKNNVTGTNRLYISEYYAAVTVPREEILVLENLTVKGFRTHDRFLSIDWEYASATVTELAKYHALSLAYQRDDPEESKYLTDYSMSDFFTDVTFRPLMQSGIASSLSVVRDENREQFKKFCDNLSLDYFKKLMEPSRVKVIMHGDFRPSNLMHRHLEDGSVQIIVVDHQTPSAGCPVNDLIYLIFTGTDQEFRTRHYQRLVEHYYSQLCLALRRLGLHPEEIYPRVDFEYELKEKLPLGLVVAIFSLPIITVEEEDAPTIGGDADGGFGIKSVGALYAARMNGVIDDFVRWGVL